MLNSQRDDSPEDDRDNETLMRFAQADGEALIKKTQKKRLNILKGLVFLPFKLPFYLILLPFWPQRITLREARQVREFFSPKPSRGCWQIGLIPYYFINWLLWHLRRHIAGLDLSVNDGKHAWEIISEIWTRIFNDNAAILSLFVEVRPHDYEAFKNRDKTFFMEQKGDIVSKSAGEILFYMLILSRGGNRFIRLLYGWICGLLDSRLLNLDKFAVKKRLFDDDRVGWMNRIRRSRREILDRLERYAENMMRFTMECGHIETAGMWNDVFCRVQRLRGYRPMPSNRSEIAQFIDKLVDIVNIAARRTYALYLQEQREEVRLLETGELPLPIEEPLPIEAKPAKERKSKKAKTRENPQKEMKIGRFKIRYFRKFTEITDTKQKTDPYKLKPDANAVDIIRRLLLNYRMGTDQVAKSNPTWKLAFQYNDAHRFKNEQIFMQPRWNAENGRYQWSEKKNDWMRGSRWRLWMDEELEYGVTERVKRFVTAHPNGYRE